MQSQGFQAPPVRRPAVIEVGGQKLGVAVPTAGGYRFVAVKLPAFAIDGHLFDSIEAAERAAGALPTLAA